MFYAFLIIFTALLSYLFMPTFAFGFYGFWFILGLSTIIPSIVSGMLDKNITLPKVVPLFISLFMGIIIAFFTSSSMFYSKHYSELIENKTPIVDSVFSKDVSPVDINNIRLVDQAYATKLGSKILGENIGLGSIAEVGTFRIQLVNGKLYWIAPLEHRSFFKWLNFDAESKSGYVKVSATNPNDVQLILDKGQIVYQKGAYFGEDIYRHIWLNGYMTQGYTDITFEIDDNGKPFYVASKIVKTQGFEGEDVVATIIVDATTGSITEYSIEDTPVWVDRIQPESIMKTQLDDYGTYQKGWLNGHFTQEEVFVATEGMSLVFGKDGNSYWYTGVKSKGSDGSTIGFVLINTRTKDTKFYKITGATETKARKSAEGIVQEKGYNGTNPILYNVLGVPTYILTLKDNEGLVKNIAMVSVENYNIVGLGINIKDALRSYKSKLLSNGNSNSNLAESVNLLKVTGLVTRVNFDIKQGSSYYYFMIKGNNKIFILDSSLNEEIVLTNIGDAVGVSYEDSKNQFITVNSFDNFTLSNEHVKEEVK